MVKICRMSTEFVLAICVCLFVCFVVVKLMGLSAEKITVIKFGAWLLLVTPVFFLVPVHLCLSFASLGAVKLKWYLHADPERLGKLVTHPTLPFTLRGTL